MVNFWTLCLMDRRLNRCFRCIGFPESNSFDRILAFITSCPTFRFYRLDLYRGIELVFREASLQ